MILYRLSSHKFAADLSGEGARLYGGRWNKIGQAAIYTSNSLSLAFLEVLCHTKLSLIKDRFSVLVLEYNSQAGDLNVFKEADLPLGWNAYPTPDHIVEIGTNWLESRATLGLGVPSAALPFPNNTEFNVLLNPNYPEFDKFVKIKEIAPFSFDERLIRLNE
jgi:RES domain-containing protein